MFCEHLLHIKFDFAQCSDATQYPKSFTIQVRGCGAESCRQQGLITARWESDLKPVIQKILLRICLIITNDLEYRTPDVEPGLVMTKFAKDHWQR